MRRDPWQAIADPTRRKIIDTLSAGSMTINEIAEQFDISRPAISKQLKILNESKLIDITSQGRERNCTLTLEGLHEVNSWIKQYERFWIDKLDRLDTYLNQKED